MPEIDYGLKKAFLPSLAAALLIGLIQYYFEPIGSRVGMSETHTLLSMVGIVWIATELYLTLLYSHTYVAKQR